jgi:hypothetical protein
MPMANTDDEDIIVLINQVNHQMLSHRVNVHRRGDLKTLRGGQWVIGQEEDTPLQLIVVAFSLVKTKLLRSGKENVDNILFGLAA